MEALNWIKHGQIFDPTRTVTPVWMAEYSQCPAPIVIDDTTIRVFFACRPSRKRGELPLSQSGFVDLDRNDPCVVKGISENPILPLGPPGSFDEFGSMSSSFVLSGHSIYAYYTGWTRKTLTPYDMAIGMAIGNRDGMGFEKFGKGGPILSSNPYEPFLVSGPVVRKFDGEWHMWYIFGIEWISTESKPEPIYRLAHAKSSDGIHWARNGEQIIESYNEDECQVSFALFRHENKWKSLFCHRRARTFRQVADHGYRIGYAESDDLQHWTRNDRLAGLEPSSEGWDSQMICYPQICEVDNRVLLFYCGNTFGREGFGMAELV
jgi:predicted GH43/DUF377 family glycosyl hydrolase